MSVSTISIIVPVLNEEKSLPLSLSHLRMRDDDELIVVDGGSDDHTTDVAREFTDKVYTSETGRARVMNFGAGKARGEIFLFLHADCVLPEEGLNIIRETVRDQSVAAGAFELSISHSGARFRIIEKAANLRARLSSLMYGDQGMFLRKEVFQRVGGFSDIPLMEDIEISRRLKKMGIIRFVRPPIQASPRRWIEEGALFTTLRDWTIAFSYSFLGISPQKLIRYYRNVR